ncbi:hypothetical protein TELCIR_04503 [Teladorsagia circumcincta]|uniref:Cyclic nucleotide-binding domain-containing protein n=1 Tax=Teladorsagia circumcincta TaxID=45464 RepID=A0A2G9UUX4_TELCI|nr:hypothetical protein TELCIR_04503 [Teladorsagia circumcincta]
MSTKKSNFTVPMNLIQGSKLSEKKKAECGLQRTYVIVSDAVIEDWIFSYDKIPDPILVSCWDGDNWNITEDDCRTDVVPPLRMFEEYSNMTQEIDMAMMYWTNRTRTIPFTKFFKQYALSFYWSALTLVTLGEQPSPNDTFQNWFEICDTLLGLVLFAVIVGDVGNMVTNMNMKRSDFEEVLDGCKSYMIYRKVQSFLQRKAVEYFAYTWSHGGGQMDEEDCEPNLLYELILKLELRVYSPLDYVCRKGDVGTEMYIVKAGSVEVVNEDGTKVSEGKSILAKDNLLEDVPEEEELEPDAPIEEQLDAASRAINEIERLLGEAEKKFRETSARTKRKLFRVEREVDKELKQILEEPSTFTANRRASAR